MTILASSASTRPSGVVTSGLISASEAPLLDEGGVELLHDLGRGLHLGEVAVEHEGELERLVREAGRTCGSTAQPDDLLGRLGGDLLDVDAARAGSP